MEDQFQDLTPEHFALLSNAGRCDICGKPIDMSSGDVLEIHEFGVPDDVTEEYDFTDTDAASMVADALDSVGESGIDWDLAETIRTKGAYKVHQRCLDKTHFHLLTVSDDRARELGIEYEDEFTQRE